MNYMDMDYADKQCFFLVLEVLDQYNLVKSGVLQYHQRAKTTEDGCHE